MEGMGVTSGAMAGINTISKFAKWEELLNNSSKSLLVVLSLVLICNFICTLLLKRFSVPRIVSEAFLGVILGGGLNNYNLFGTETRELLYIIIQGSTVGYMFALGMEVDPTAILRVTRESTVAYAGMIPTFVAAYFASKPLGLVYFKAPPDRHVLKHVILRRLTSSFLLSSTASPLLTRMVTDLKIGKSDIGRFVVAAGMHCDFVSTLLLAVVYIINLDNLKVAIEAALAMATHSVFTAKLGPILMGWVNGRNPPGRPINESELVLSVAMLACLFVWLTSFRLMFPYSAFMTGLFLPKEGRLSKLLIGKVNSLLSGVTYPLVFVYTGAYLWNTGGFKEFIVYIPRSFYLFGIVTAGKVVGTVAVSMKLGLYWREAAFIGLFLSVKGYPHLYTALISTHADLTQLNNLPATVIATVCTVAYIPLLGANIIKRARKRSPIQRMALQWLDPSNELRMMLCLWGAHNVRPAINFMEISQGTADPGIVVYATDVIELTDTIAATLVRGDGADAVTVSDKSVTEMRKKITDSFQAYVDSVGGAGQGITLRRMIAVSKLDNMHQEICVLAEDLMVSIIILPFHKTQQVKNGKFDDGHAGFRYVNRKVLRHAPCSVGILVDRGLGTVEKISRSSVCLYAAVIFIGGKDDRESLAYAGHIARHPGLKLTVIRFMVDTDQGSGGPSARSGAGNAAEQEREMKADDECFAEFYERHVVEGQVAYMEKHLVNSAEAFSTLHSLERQYGLFIVGRGGRANSVLTVGMSDWQQCPELGPIGDILSGPDFSPTASVLVIQQHTHRGELDGLDDEFSIM